MPARPRLSLSKRVGFSVIALVAILPILEIGVRLAWTPPPKYIAQPGLRTTSLYMQDPLVGWRTRPNYTLSYRFHWGDTVTIRTNSRGFRDVDHDPSSPSGRPRIVILGDSHTFGLGVRENEVFAEHLRRSIPDAEVINMGMTGYNLAQEHALFRAEGLDYRPCIVLLAFCMNDVTMQVTPPPRANNRIIVQTGWKHFITEHVRLYDLCRLELTKHKTIGRMFVALHLKDRLGGFEQIDDNLRPFLIREPDELKREWASTFAELAAIQGTCRSLGARLMIAPVPARQTVDRADLETTLSYVNFEPSDFDLDKGYRKLEGFCQRAGIDFIDPVALFRSAGGELYLPADVHLSPRGHQVFASAVAPKLQERVRRSDVSRRRRVKSRAQIGEWRDDSAPAGKPGAGGYEPPDLGVRAAILARTLRFV